MRIPQRNIYLLGLISAISLGSYLMASQIIIRVGFPLDDAWIHQTYARNLAQDGDWAFIPGERSGGSTSPLWSAFLAVGPLMGLGPYIWTYVLSWLTLWGTCLIATALFQTLCPEHARFSIWIGVFIAMEWHIVWFTASGMETLLFTFISMLVIHLLLYNQESENMGIWIGILIGVTVWIRPDGITLLGPALLITLLLSVSWRRKVTIITGILAGFVFLFTVYLGFNKVTAGTFWPNTFFAKQAEYAELKQNPFLGRFWMQIFQPLEGAGIVLLPGVLLVVIEMIRRKRWEIAAVLLWVVGYIGLYAWRLPVTYQNGRYVFPVMPVFFILGFTGFANWVWKGTSGKMLWILKVSWNLILILVTVGTWFIGARAYGRDVKYIETEMVDIANWLNKNTPEDAIIAVHDIGAIGYFGNRKLLDLAGLISPEVIPFIRDEDKLSLYLDSHRATYLVTFPDWYPKLVEKGILIYQTKGNIRPSMGGENMAVYRWPIPK